MKLPQALQPGISSGMEASMWFAPWAWTQVAALPSGPAVAHSTVPYNNGLHQTGRGGVAFASRRRPVVEARPAGEPECCTDRRTDRRIFVPPPSAVAEAHPCYRDQTDQHWRRWSGPSAASAFYRKSLEHLPRSCRLGPDRLRFHGHRRGSASVINHLVRSFTIGTSWLGGARPHNNALHQTGRGGVAFRSSRPVVEARLAGEGRC